MNLTVIVPPPVEPVSAAEAFRHLRLDPIDSPEENEAEYPAVMSHIRTAREWCEAYTGRAFVRQTMRLSGRALSRFRRGVFDYAQAGPWGDWRFNSDPFQDNAIELLRPPTISIASVKFFDAANALQTVDPASYYVTDEFVPRLCFVAGYGLPGAHSRPDALRIEYVAGYPAGTPADDYDATDPDAVPVHLAANVPHAVRSAILIQCRLLHEKLDPQEAQQQADARDALLWPLRIISLA